MIRDDVLTGDGSWKTGPCASDVVLESTCHGNVEGADQRLYISSMPIYEACLALKS
ncbi:hypothetical protein BGZ61DRAFT_446136 [Ilyonectria robusta]|uniref:uncharacterized protein n=1 Tax=Ilyonectria robusta TaxID=1079257 RepID=UPI001E8E8712|nr:uncharacterized protein BGZ61DRAFT_446136 [Ilyonectria robusta]KAH8729304.1 hypothetical protein BGZ61DRAFT_446136 [Ilyonectria robusta]